MPRNNPLVLFFGETTERAHTQNQPSERYIVFKDLKCSELGSEDYNAIDKIFRSAFEVDENPDVLRQFVKKNDRVVMLYDGTAAIAFMFFTFRVVDGMRLVNFGLTAKHTHRKNTLKILGSYVLVRYFVLNPIWLTRTSVAVIVANNPKSYLSFANAGIPMYPSLYQPELELRDFTLYQKILTEMHLEHVDERGILSNSMAPKGFAMQRKEVAYEQLSDKGQAYVDYVGGDTENALVAVIIGRPLFDAPPYYLRLVARTLGHQASTKARAMTQPLNRFFARDSVKA